MEESHTHSHGLSLDETISCGDYLLNATPLVAIEPIQIQINPRKRNSATSTTIHRRGRPSAARRTGKTQRSLVKEVPKIATTPPARSLNKHLNRLTEV